MTNHDSRRNFLTLGGRAACALLAAALLGACGKDAPLTPVDVAPKLAALSSLASVSPDSATAGDAGVTLTVGGRHFERGSVVRWNGADLPTTFVSKWSLRASVDAPKLAAGGTYAVAVFTPGDGITPARTFTVYHAAPALARISPDSALIGGGDTEVVVEGSGFAPASVVRWNGLDRPTRFESATRLAFTVPAADLAAGGVAHVNVFNPAPGGGVSARLEFRVLNPRPSITHLPTRGATAGGSGFTLAVNGERFLPGSTVHWNGSPRTTTYVSVTRLTASILASDLAAPGEARVTVVSPGPGGGASNEAVIGVRLPGAATVTSERRIPLAVHDLVWDPATRRIYATVHSGTHANTIAIIDPEAGTVEETVFIGSTPRALARSSDGQFLYAGVDGSFSVRRFDVATRTAGPEFSLGSGFWGPFRAEDIAVMPDSPHVVAVARRNTGISPRHEGVAVFSHGVQRPATTPGHTGSNVIEFGDVPGVLYGQNSETTEFGFRRMRIDASGVTVTSVKTGLFSLFYPFIAWEAGRFYSNLGPVFEAETATPVGQCPRMNGVRPDAETGRVFSLSDRSITVCDMNSFQTLGTLTIGSTWNTTSLYPLVRWGADGLAFRDDDELILVRSPIVAP